MPLVRGLRERALVHGVEISRSLRAGKAKLPTSLFSLAALLVFPFVSAQETSPSAHDPSTNGGLGEITHLVDEHYNHLHSLRAQFTESYEGMGMTRQESGTMLLLKPGRMRWDYSSPKGKIFLLDGKYAWSYSPSNQQVQRLPAKQLDDLRSPLRFLLGHTEIRKELVNLKMSPGSNGEFMLTGQPRGQEDRVRRVTLHVNGDGSLAGIEVEETDGAITRFSFSNQQPDAPIPEQTFKFTPPPGVPVVDAPPPV